MPTEYSTLPERLIAAVDRAPDSRAQIHKVGDQWKDIPAREMLRRIAGLSHALVRNGRSRRRPRGHLRAELSRVARR